MPADQRTGKARELRPEEGGPPFQKPNPKRWATPEETKSKSSQRIKGDPPAPCNTTFREQTYIRWCCIDLLRSPRLSGIDAKLFEKFVQARKLLVDECLLVTLGT